MHASSASDYLTTASIVKLFVLLATLFGLLPAARGARRIELPPLARRPSACCWQCRRRSR